MSKYDVMLRKRINGVRLWNVNDYDYDTLITSKVCKVRGGNPAGKRKKTLDVYCSFDIETSRLKKIDHSFMYVFMFAIGERDCIIGRTWWEFKQLMLNIAERVPDGVILKVWVMNLAYEFSFLKGIYQFTPEDVFILNGRRVAKCRMLDKIEFCCAYIQTNMSLRLLTETYKVLHQKLSGDDFDYNKLRFPWDELDDEELGYCVNDVIGLNEAMRKRCESDDDTLHTIPLTSTGYVRRIVKRRMRTYPHTRLVEMLPDYKTYELLEECFRGGDTHANRFLSGHILCDRVISYDRVSSYPDVIMNCRFPMGEWHLFDKPCVNWLHILLDDNVNALLITIELTNVCLKDRLWPSPYIAKHKCRKIEGGVYDNGRVLKAERIELVCNDVDFRIIDDTYDFEIDVHEIRFSKYGLLPEEIRDCTMEFFKNKTELKGVEENKSLYDKSKALLNSIYGMMAQKWVKQNIEYVWEEKEQFHETGTSRLELFERAKKKAFLSYAWSVWVTSWSRFRLYEGVKIAHENGGGFVYCDTDSVKFLHNEDAINAFEEYNKKRVADSINSGAYATDIHGKTHYMGLYELDGEYDRFITLGAKKYAYEKNGELKITIAGVNKIAGAKELSELGGLEAVKVGTVFHKAGGLEAVYNDKCLFEHKVGKRKILITDNVCLKPSTYTIGLTSEYLNLILREQRSVY